MAALRIAHVVPVLYRNGCGVSEAVRQLTQAESRLGAHVDILTEAIREFGATQMTSAKVESWAGISALPHGSWRTLARADVIHLHTPWSAWNWAAAGAALFYKKPYLITPHGMLDQWALRSSQWKKKVARRILVDRMFDHAGAMHALSPAEARDIEGLGITSPIALVPNGIDIAELAPPSPESLPAPSRVPTEPFILFLGRIHPKKGLAVLVDAWGAVVARHPGWRLVIAGPDQAEIVSGLRATATLAGTAGSISFVGALQGAEKIAFLRASSGFVLPSFSEGVPMAVLEAMACGVPVVITRECNLPEVGEARAGLIGDPTVPSVAEMLIALLDKTDAERRALGERGVELVRSRFARERSAVNLLAVYEWLCRGGAQPATVTTRQVMPSPSERAPTGIL